MGHLESSPENPRHGCLWGLALLGLLVLDPSGGLQAAATGEPPSSPPSLAVVPRAAADSLPGAGLPVQRSVPVHSAPAVSAPEGPGLAGEPLQIGLSEAAQEQAQEEALRQALDLFRKASGGDDEGRRRWEALPRAERVPALGLALEGGAREVRLAAGKELAAACATGSDLEERLRAQAAAALAQAAVRDSEEEVRERAREGWLARVQAGDPGARQALEEMAKGLEGENPLERRRAWNALKAVGGRDVVEVIVRKITRRWGRGPRGHLLVATQRSYIADYDVSGAVFDPVIRSFLTGVVLDNRCLMIEMIQYVMEELGRLGAGEAVVKDPVAWERFLQEQKAGAGVGR